MKKSSDLDIKPIDVKEFTCKQSKHSDVVPNLPLRGVLLSPSGGGKSVLLANLILKVHRGCFERIYICLVLALMLILRGSLLKIH